MNDTHLQRVEGTEPGRKWEVGRGTEREHQRETRERKEGTEGRRGRARKSESETPWEPQTERN